MSLAPLFDAHPVIQIHAYAAIAAFLLGGLVLFRRKGDGAHRALGRVWVGLMLAVGLTSFFIWELRVFGLFSPIHLLSVATLYWLYRALRFARLRQIAAHRRTMQGLYVGALAITGVFTFAPGRIMHEVAFGADGASLPEVGVFLFGIAAAGAALVLVSRHRPARAQNAASMPRS